MQHNKLLAAALAFSLGACAADTDTADMQEATPSTFKLRIENIAPWTVLKSGVQATRTNGTSGALAMGQAYEISFTAGKNQKVSFASMFGESNDWFFAPGAAGIALYDSNGNPVSGDVTNQIKVYDAGTEIDQEPGVGDAVGPNQPAPDYGAPDPIAMVRTLGATVPLTGGGTFAMPDVADMIKVTLTPGQNRQFTLRIENVSTTSTLWTTQGTRDIHISPAVWALHLDNDPLFTLGTADRAQGLELVAESGRSAMLQSALRQLSGWSTPISPGVYALHQDPEPLYALGLADRGQGLERLAEDGNSSVLGDAMMGVAAADAMSGLTDTGVFEVPVSADQRGPVRPGDAYELTLTAVPGDHVSFVTMFGMSNDWFFATTPEGIPLFDADGTPMRGEVTSYIALYDAGTELDQEPAIGESTGPQQAAPNTGAIDPVLPVRLVPSSQYGVPASSHLRVTLTPQ
jgi:hypothetical protein